MIVNALKTVFWWVLEIIATIVYGIRGMWRISRTPYSLVEKKYMPVKILTTILKIAILIFIFMYALTIVFAIVVSFILVRSFLSSAESAMRDNF